jgi:SAM-dependent methyltransferase
LHHTDFVEAPAGSQDSAVSGTIDRVSERREPLRRTFDTAADLYEAARPSYPEELFDDLVALAALEPGARLLEIGCATGKATRSLLERDFSVVCVEMGAQLAERARRNLAGFPFEIHIATFEGWEGEPEAFELVYAATAWHWVDPAIGYSKAHRLLRPGGHLAFWSAGHAFPADFDRFFAEIQEVYDAIGESHPGQWPPPPPEQIPDEVAEIEASGLFEEIQVRRYVWEKQYSAEEYIALLNTLSGHIAMETAKREHLYRREGQVDDPADAELDSAAHEHLVRPRQPGRQRAHVVDRRHPA